MRSDAELLEAWREGDARAGGELFGRHFDAVYAFFRNKAFEGVDDLVQQTFMACVEGRDRFRGEGSFRAYMLGAARRILYRAIDGWQQDRRVDAAVSSLHDLRTSPSQVVARRGEQRLILEGLRRIPIEQQVALELYHLQGYRGPELAAILEVPEATVRSRLYRGLQSLRAAVREVQAAGPLLDATLGELEPWLASLAEVVAGPPEPVPPQPT